ncbi:hypothetical protein POPTR_014G161400v4 [Populus trichocarpa]|uniref:Uncharacterized protein n=1 Tax=Populus trichocarpa TaxID=3694 RepID=A0ACC0RZW5_POPTR|nr:hypothetical protein POPTR_014G161400v4 [Populus trichocarpa]
MVNHELMREDEAQRYCHQLINIVDHCHSKGVSHRDLKGIKSSSIKPRERRDRERKPLKLLHPLVEVGDLGLVRFL